MSDNNGVLKTSAKPQHYFLPGFLFALAGLMLHPIFFIGTLGCLIAAQGSRQHKIIAGMLGIVFVLAAFGYTLGKDLAVRDNARDAKVSVDAGKTP